MTKQQRDAFRDAVRKMVVDFKAKHGFRKSLRVKRPQRHQGVYEMTWADDGRTLFGYGVAKHDDDLHIIWLSIGTHEILDQY